MTTPLDDGEMTELTDADFPRVDLVGKAANGFPRFLIAKAAADGTGMFDPAYVRTLIRKAGGAAAGDGDRRKAEKKARKAAKKAAKRAAEQAKVRAEMDAARTAGPARQPASGAAPQMGSSEVAKARRSSGPTAAQVAARAAQAVAKADAASAAMMTAAGIDVRKVRLVQAARQGAYESDERWLAVHKARQAEIRKATEARQIRVAKATELRHVLRIGTAAEQNNAALQLNAMAVEALAARRAGRR